MPKVRYQRRHVLQVVVIESAIGPSHNGDAKFGGMNVSCADERSTGGHVHDASQIFCFVWWIIGKTILIGVRAFKREMDRIRV